jgi:hypothetical protein
VWRRRRMVKGTMLIHLVYVLKACSKLRCLWVLLYLHELLFKLGTGVGSLVYPRKTSSMTTSSWCSQNLVTLIPIAPPSFQMRQMIGQKKT